MRRERNDRPRRLAAAAEAQAVGRERIALLAEITGVRPAAIRRVLSMRCFRMFCSALRRESTPGNSDSAAVSATASQLTMCMAKVRFARGFRPESVLAT